MDASGTNVSTAISFTAGGAILQQLTSFVIRNDTTALESDEMYFLNFTSHNFTIDQTKVALGAGTLITIEDDDSK